MLQGKELGAAIERAIQLKIDSGTVQSKADVARDLGVSPNVVYGWLRTGSISKERLPSLWVYFVDVAGPEHWGLPKEILEAFRTGSEQNERWPFRLTSLEDVISLTPDQLQQLDHILAGVLMGLRSQPSVSPQTKSKVRGSSAA